MQRINEIKSIMRQLKESKNESLITAKSVNEEAENDTSTENDTSDADLLLARLEDIITRFEKALANVDGEGEEEQANDDEEQAEDEEPAEDEEEAAPAEDEDEEQAEESYTRSLEDRLSALERRFTESRRRSLCKRFTR